MLLADLTRQLTQLKSVELKSIAHLCGSTTSGTKLVLATALAEAVSKRTRNLAKAYRIISVDLGIDNIGVCQILAPPFSSAKAGPKPIVERWFHYQFPSPFEHRYPWFSDATIDVCRTITGSEKAQAIIFEKQRSRTASSSSIPNSILRVNVLEGMAFTALRLEEPEALLQSVSPRGIVDFWRTITTESPRKATSSQMYKEAKLVRRKLVDRWRTEADKSPLAFSQPFDHTHLKKRDDVNDALVQGYTWLIWRDNCARLAANFRNNRSLNTDLKHPNIDILN